MRTASFINFINVFVFFFCSIIHFILGAVNANGETKRCKYIFIKIKGKNECVISFDYNDLISINYIILSCRSYIIHAIPDAWTREGISF